MGRKTNTLKLFLESCPIYENEIKPFLIVEIKNDRKRQIQALYSEEFTQHLARQVDAKLKPKVERLLAIVENAKNFKELTKLYHQKETVLKSRKLDDFSESLSLNYYQNIVSVIKYYPYIIEAKEKTIQEPIFNESEFSRILDARLLEISSKPERQKWLYNFANKLERRIRAVKSGKRAKRKFIGFPFYKKEKLWLHKSMNLDSALAIIYEKIKAERIRITVKEDYFNSFNLSTKKIISPHNYITNETTELFRRLAEFGGIIFHPIDSFIKSEIAISARDTSTPKLSFQTYLKKNLKPREIIFSLMTLVPELFERTRTPKETAKGDQLESKPRHTRIQTKYNFFKCGKEEFKYWVINLNIPGVGQHLLDNCLYKPLKNTDIKFAKGLIKQLNKPAEGQKFIKK